MKRARDPAFAFRQRAFGEEEALLKRAHTSLKRVHEPGGYVAAAEPAPKRPDVEHVRLSDALRMSDNEEEEEEAGRDVVDEIVSDLRQAGEPQAGEPRPVRPADAWVAPLCNWTLEGALEDRELARIRLASRSNMRTAFERTTAAAASGQSGEIVLRAIMRNLEILDRKYKRSFNQRRMHKAFLGATLRKIFGPDLPKHVARLMREYGFDTRSSVIVTAKRREGKTFGTALFVAAFAMAANFTVEIYSTGSRASRKLLLLIIKLMTELAGTTDCILESNKENTVIRNGLGGQSKVYSYPSRADIDGTAARAGGGGPLSFPPYSKHRYRRTDRPPTHAHAVSSPRRLRAHQSKKIRRHFLYCVVDRAVCSPGRSVGHPTLRCSVLLRRVLHELSRVRRRPLEIGDVLAATPSGSADLDAAYDKHARHATSDLTLQELAQALRGGALGGGDAHERSLAFDNVFD
jgi:hypothetical protein